MTRVGNIGTRIELTSMDAHFREITIGLYEQRDDEDTPVFLVHTYSGRDGAQMRVQAVAKAMQVLGAMKVSAAGLLRFPCGREHLLACKRIFIEACKLDPSEPLAPRPLFVHDRKSAGLIVAVAMGDGGYRLEPETDGDAARRRALATARGLAKLAGLQAPGEGEGRVAFDCGHAHDALVGLLLARAINVRAAMRAQEAAAARGVLAAPSAA